MPGRNVLVLDIAVEYCEQQPLLSLASFLILILLFGFLPVLVPVCLPLLRLLFEKQSEPDFWKDFLLLYNNMIINGRNFGNKAKLYIYISSSALFLALTCIININFHHQLCNYSIKPYRIKRSLYISSNIIHDIDLHSDTRYWTLNYLLRD